MTHITRLQADNFKRLTAIDIRPGDGAVKIRGDNAQGKSSTLDAILAVFGGKGSMPARPVRNGEDEGAIRITLDDGAIALRRFTVDGKDSIEFTNAEGFKAPSPQKMLEALYSSVAFDPLAFTLQKPDEQFAALRSLVKLDVDLDEHEKLDKADYDARRDTNRDLKNAQAELAQMPVYDGLPAEPIDEAALEQKITEAAEHNGAIEKRKVKREEFIAAMGRNKDNLEAMKIELADLQGKIDDFEKIIADQEKQIAGAAPLPEPIDVADTQTQLRTARDTNGKLITAQRRAAAVKNVEMLEAKAKAFTEAMDARATARDAAIAAADMPVPGLAFGDGEVLFNGVPLEQISMSERIRIGGAIGAALNPKLKVMLVRDASLLSDKGQEALAEMAAEHGFQLWVEAVDTSGKVGIVIEDGAVVAIDGAAPPEVEPIAKVKRRAKGPIDAPQEVVDKDVDRLLAKNEPGPTPEAPGPGLAGDQPIPDAYAAGEHLDPAPAAPKVDRRVTDGAGLFD
ncbi:MAG TPA: AAA family ATPase [Sphingomonas sp.]